MFDMHPRADERYVVKGEKYRFTVLTDRMLRLEYSENGVFEDRATRLAFNRCFDTPEYEVYEQDGLLHIKTKHLHLTYDKKEFSEIGLQITVDGSRNWFFGQKLSTMPGTVRTLDRINGEIPLGPSVLNRQTGIATVDDSQTTVIGEDGWPVPSEKNRIDVYFFGYYADYAGAIRDFYKLSAPLPLIPRFAFGNWWSRYHKYSSEEYLELMDRFKEERLPFSVAVIDMDWHLTSTPDSVLYGTGWTGYTWNRELFPDPDAFLSELHTRGLRTALNLHPKDGIRAFEEVYPEMCNRLGLDASEGKQIEFDVSSQKFMEAYFDTVLNPLEKRGVDFWWIDWQQTAGTRIEGYDVLWMLNHCHYTDNARNGRRPLLFSRYAEIGSHRYPIGFSGDTHITWESLNFQPYFTAMASNIGFSMWSHDIGGFFFGYRDPELYTRWVQLGVFSPITRLHSSASPFNSKEPWNRGPEAEAIAGSFLRLRHRLIPYIYTSHYKNHAEGKPLVRPLYFEHPREPEAFNYKTEYYFGDDLLVAPITSQRDADSLLGKTKLWLPAGSWIDFFTGRIYEGNRALDVYRHLDSMPVFARAGSIIPMAADSCGNCTDNPSDLELKIFGGDNGAYTLIEDNDKIGAANKVSATQFSFEYGKLSRLCIAAASECDYIPKARTYRASFVAFECPTEVSVSVNGAVSSLKFEYDKLSHTVICEPIALHAGEHAEITLVTDGELPENEIGTFVHEAIMRGAHLLYADCTKLESIAKSPRSALSRISDVLSRPGNEYLKGYIVELLSAK